MRGGEESRSVLEANVQTPSLGKFIIDDDEHMMIAIERFVIEAAIPRAHRMELGKVDAGAAHCFEHGRVGLHGAE